MPITLDGSGSLGGIDSITTSASVNISGTELGYLDNTTSAIQTQLNASKGMILITSGTLSTGTVVLSSIPATYRDLRLVIRNYLPATDNIGINMRVNGDSSANRYRVFTQSVQATWSQSAWNPGYGNDNSVAQGLQVFEFFDYANTSTWKFMRYVSLTNNSTTSTNPDFDIAYGGYNQIAAISSITIYPSSGNFTSGEYLLYGVQ